MEEKINIAQLLREQGVPSGTELYTTSYGECTIVRIKNNKDEDQSFPIIVKTIHNNVVCQLTANGYCNGAETGECILFPSKDQRDWSKYHYEKPVPSVDEIAKDYLNNTVNLHLFMFDNNPKLLAIITMLAVADYLNDGWIADWNSSTDKFEIEYNGSISNVLIANRIYSNTSPVVFKTEELARKAIEMLGEETIKLALS